MRGVIEGEKGGRLGASLMSALHTRKARQCGGVVQLRKPETALLASRSGNLIF
jgi:hypothetical protein